MYLCNKSIETITSYLFIDIRNICAVGRTESSFCTCYMADMDNIDFNNLLYSKNVVWKQRPVIASHERYDIDLIALCWASDGSSSKHFPRENISVCIGFTTASGSETLRR